MEHGSQICSSKDCDYNFVRHVGYKESNVCIQKYYSPETVKIISKKVTELLQGVDPDNRPIIVPDKTICAVMDNIYTSFRPGTGDIYTRYIIPNGLNYDSYVQDMIDQVIQVITNDVKNNLGMDECNSKLSIWTTVLGDFNEHGLRQHPPIKIRNKTTNNRGMVSFMSY